MLRAKFAAFAIHLSISAVLIGAFIAGVLLVWYPSPLLDLQGGGKVIALLVLVDVVLGPTLTLLVFAPGKKSLRFDLSVIVAVQLLAFAYGAWVVYTERPAYLVFAYSQFHVVRAGDLMGEPPAGIAGADRFGPYGPPVVQAKIPEAERRSGRGIISALMGDPTHALRSAEYEIFPYDRDELARERLRTEDVLPYFRERVEPLRERLHRRVEDFYYYRIKGRVAEGVAVVDPVSWRLVDIADVDLLEALKPQSGK